MTALGLLLLIAFCGGARAAGIDVDGDGAFECLCNPPARGRAPALMACRVGRDILHLCECTTRDIEHRNEDVYAQLSQLVREPYFRFFRIDLQHGCSFWSDSEQCTQRDCSVDTVEGSLERSLQDIDRSASALRARVEASAGATPPSPWMPSDPQDATHVDIVSNPERYTGYAGARAARVWHAIYENVWTDFDEVAFAPFSAMILC